MYGAEDIAGIKATIDFFIEQGEELSKDNPEDELHKIIDACKAYRQSLDQYLELSVKDKMQFHKLESQFYAELQRITDVIKGDRPPLVAIKGGKE